VQVLQPGRRLVCELAGCVSLSHLRARADRAGGTAVHTPPVPVLCVLFNDLLLLCLPKEGCAGSAEPNSHTVAEAVDLASAQLRKCVCVRFCVYRLVQSMVLLG
jgi:hypothetical protein